MPEGNHLTLAKFGIENTLYPEITPPKHQEAFQLLEILSQIDIFSGFPIEKAKEFLQVVKEEKFRRGEQIIKKELMGIAFLSSPQGMFVLKDFRGTILRSKDTELMNTLARHH